MRKTGHEGYRPGIKPFEALWLLVTQLRVPAAGLKPMQKAGFTLLAKRGLAKLNASTREWAPAYENTHEAQLAWWAWAENITGLEER